MQDSSSTHKLYEFLLKYALKLEEVQKAQDVKLATLVAGSYKQLEKSISEQQAAVMAIESLEKKRISLQQEIGFGSMTFRQILAVCDSAYKERLQEVFDRISSAVMSIRFANQKAMDYAKEILDLDAGQQGYGYTEDADKTSTATGAFLTTKI